MPAALIMLESADYRYTGAMVDIDDAADIPIGIEHEVFDFERGWNTKELVVFEDAKKFRKYG
jgi:hypothetical protein